jgi:uncharacterized membrane protein YfcA
MIQLPALLAVMPGAAPASLITINKLAAAAGTTGAALRYTRAMPPPWPEAFAWAACAGLLSALGALTLSLLPAAPVRQAIPVVILGVLALSAGTRLGEAHAPRFTARLRALWGSAGAAMVGFYDGLLGPGAGTFYQLLFVRALGFDFLHAASPAKLCNLASNVAAILVLVASVPVPAALTLTMAAANFAGGRLGSRFALLHGNRFVRRVYYVVAGALVLKALHDAWA